MQTQPNKDEREADALLADIEAGRVDPGKQDNELEQAAQSSQLGTLLSRFARYENALNKIYHQNDNTVEAHKELSAARQSLSDITRIAKAAFNAKYVPAEGDRLIGKALRDWATAIMENRGVTRAVARERIMDAIKLMTATEYPALTPNVVREYVVEPNVTQLDHLPEGSH